MAELSKGPMPDQVTAMAMYEHAPNPNGVRPQRLVGVDRTPVARVAAKVLSMVLAGFLMTNKVWSPQYVVWLVPLAVLARPRLWPYLLWQLAEVAYFFGIWGFLIFNYIAQGHAVTGYQGVSTGWYFATLAARFLAVGLLAAYVVRDILWPGRDVVRAQGIDDPAGGVLDGTGDQFRLRWPARGTKGEGR